MVKRSNRNMIVKSNTRPLYAARICTNKLHGQIFKEGCKFTQTIHREKCCNEQAANELVIILPSDTNHVSPSQIGQKWPCVTFTNWSKVIKWGRKKYLHQNQSELSGLSQESSPWSQSWHHMKRVHVTPFPAAQRLDSWNGTLACNLTLALHQKVCHVLRRLL